MVKISPKVTGWCSAHMVVSGKSLVQMGWQELSFLLKIGILLSSVILLFSKAHFLLLEISWASLVAQLVKDLPAMQETLGSIPGLRRSPGEGKGYPLQYSGLENSMDCIEILHGKNFTWRFLFQFVWDTKILQLGKVKVKKVKLRSCPTLCNPMDCILQGSSVHGIFQARVLEWVASSFSRGSS